jgi:DedD protein
MDEQLKRRLMGATIIVTLSVIFVPMLFEDKSEGPASAAPEAVPALPEAIEQHAIELPKSAEDVAAGEKPVGKDNKKRAETGYRVIPLEDPPAKAEPPPAARQAAVPTEDAEVPVDEEGADEGVGETPPPVKPQTKGALKEAPKAALTAKGTPIPAGKAKPGTTAARSTGGGEEPEFTPEEAPPVKATEAPAKKVDKPKSLVPAKPAAIPTNKLAPPAKPAEAHPSAKAVPVKPVAAPKPVPPVATTNLTPAPAKPQEPKPPASPEAASQPASWSVQAGSFTGEANARTLVDRLRKAGLPANMQVSQGQSGPVYRVAVGAGTSRAQAEQIHKQIESAVGIKGIIQSHR